MKKKKGLAIEYVMILMAIISVLIVLILTGSVASTTKTNQYKNYLKQKNLIDDIAMTYISYQTSNQYLNIHEILNEKYQENDFELYWQIDNYTLLIFKDRDVLLYVEMGKVDNKMVLLTYRYGLI